MLELTVRLVVSLTIVVGLLLLLARVGGRKFRGNAGALVHVVHRQPLSRTSAVAVVTVGSRVLVLGTTEQQIRVLAELDPEELDVDDATILELAGPTADVELTPDIELVEMTARVQGRRPGSHRATPAAKPTAPTGPTTGALAGSVLSPQTWRQAFAAVRRAS